MRVGHDPFDLSEQGFADPLVLVAGMDREQADDAHAGYRPEPYGADDRLVLYCHEDVFLFGVRFEALNGFCRPAAHGVNRGIFAEGVLLHLEDCREIGFGCWSNVHHSLASG